MMAVTAVTAAVAEALRRWLGMVVAVAAAAAGWHRERDVCGNDGGAIA